MTPDERSEVEAAIAGTDVNCLINVRAKLVLRRKSIDSQLSDSTAGMRMDRADMIAMGMHPREADLRSSAETDHEWRARATRVNRDLDAWLTRIKARLSELSAISRVYAAVAIAGGAKTAEAAAGAVNDFLAKGCKISHVFAVGADLVIVATDPAS